MYVFICIIHDIISTLYDNNPYSLWHHMHYIHYITHIIYDISSTLYDVTFTMCVPSHNCSIFDIKLYMFMTYSLYMASHTVLSPNNHCVPSQPICLTLHSGYFWYYIKCTNFMKRSEGMSSQRLYVWHHMQHMTSYSLFMTSHHFIYDVMSTVSNITSTLSDSTSTVPV